MSPSHSHALSIWASHLSSGPQAWFFLPAFPTEGASHSKLTTPSWGCCLPPSQATAGKRLFFGASPILLPSGVPGRR